MNIKPLILFNEIVDRLERCELTKRMATPTYHIQYEKIMTYDWVAFNNISEDDLDAFILNLRLLIQNRDGLSINCIAKLYEEDLIPKQLAIAFAEQKNKWHAYLNSPSLIRDPIDTKNISNEDLFNIVLYGGLAHKDPKYHDKFICLTKQGAFSAFVFGAFLSTLKTILDILREMREINNKLILVLKG